MFINKNKALERSNLAHTRLHFINYNRKDLVSADYHFEVGIKQNDKNRILTKKERKKIFHQMMKKHKV